MFEIRILIVLILIGLSPNASAKVGGYHKRGDVDQFIAEMREEGFKSRALKKLFAKARYQQNIIDAISRPAEKTLEWKKYQNIFITRSRVKKGLKFMAENRQVLQNAERQYGVPAEMITAIIGVETMYGRIRGKYRVIDALSTLAFDYPARGAFFRKELKQFLLLAKEEGRVASEPLGSYAGAMGYGQFMPSSFREYAVDFDDDGVRDIWNNPTDAIGSVANYFKRHGWVNNQLIVVRATGPDKSSQKLFNTSLKLSSTLGEMSQSGVAFMQKKNWMPIASTKVSPIMLNGKEGKEYWLGFQNFYVITRYNHSRLYAMAVFQLSEQLRLSLESK